jgi:hypothetical protein
MERAIPVISESRKELFSGIETSPEFSSAGFYERHLDIKKTQSKERKEMKIKNEDLFINCLATGVNRMEHLLNKETKYIRQALLWYNLDEEEGIPDKDSIKNTLLLLLYQHLYQQECTLYKEHDTQRIRQKIEERNL